MKHSCGAPDAALRNANSVKKRAGIKLKALLRSNMGLQLASLKHSFGAPDAALRNAKVSKET